MLVNESPEPDGEEMVTRASLFDKGMLPLIQTMSMSVSDMKVSVAGLMDMVQVRPSVVLPA